MKQLTHTLLMLLLLAAPARAWGQEGVVPFADVLAWRASEQTSSIWANTATQDVLAVKNVQFDWNAGLRAGLGYASAAHGWDARVYWTYFQTSYADAIPPGEHVVLSEFFSTFIANPPSLNNVLFTSGDINWRLLYNTVDFEVGYPIAIDANFSVRPTLGLKIASINQTVAANWANPDELFYATENIQHDFLGVGPSFGVDGRWNVPRAAGLSFVGSFSGALLAGVWNVNDTYTQVFPPVTVPNTYQSFTTSLANSTMGTLMLRYFCGLEWTYVGRRIVSLRAGYEMQWWASQQRITAFQQLPMHGDLTLQGVSCGLSLGF